jgi:hypothetical protein
VNDWSDTVELVDHLGSQTMKRNIALLTTLLLALLLRRSRTGSLRGSPPKTRQAT